MKNASEKAFAKINLFLDVLSVRDDGFHEVKTVMHSITLADDLDISLTEGSDKSHTLCVIGDDSIPRDEGNLVLRAVKAFESRVPLCGSLRITLKKNIPSAAGLGGGSADAAATLRALNRLSGTKLSDSELMKIAASLGSDVPFCLLGGTALCEGRGERLSVVSNKTRLNLVVAVSRGEYVSTPKAYGELDKLYSDFEAQRDDGAEKSYDALRVFLSGGEFPEMGLYNIFESVVLSSCHGASELKRMMIELGAIGSTMSGSGPGVFGIFDSEESARKATQTLMARGVRAYFAQSV
jgi:4-diphosphocytidyl-2-C-methyl-D-erythritol kinase